MPLSMYTASAPRFIHTFYFPVATAYGLLRHNGVEIGKRDFLGQV